MQYVILWWSSVAVGAGTKSKLDLFCGLARGNLQFPRVLGLQSQSKSANQMGYLDTDTPVY